MLNKLFKAVAVLGVAVSAIAASANPMNGIYSGEIEYTNGAKLPLEISLNLSNEVDANGTKVIDGSFMLDGEGGPYVFTKVNLDVTSGEINLRYSRSKIDLSPNHPAALRFIGLYAVDASISGKVISGLRGEVGTFKVKKTSEAKVLAPRTNNYAGKWVGTWKYVGGMGAGHVIKNAVLNLQPTLSMVQNPNQYELDYSPGRTGSVALSQYVILPFSTVNIDYLRRGIVAQSIATTLDGTSNITSTMQLKDDNTIVGTADSSQWGRTAEFVFKRVK